jgi:short-subunit dehydrogenase involved in D-alanine esterification of teichoic acids
MENIDCEGFVADVGLKADRQKLVDFTIESYNKLDILVSNSPYSHVSNTLSQETNAMCSESVNMYVTFLRQFILKNSHFTNFQR